MKNLVDGSLKILGLLVQNLKWIVFSLVLVAGAWYTSSCSSNKEWDAKYKIFYDSTQILLAQSKDLQEQSRHEALRADSAEAQAARIRISNNDLEQKVRTLRDSSDLANQSLDSLLSTLGPINPITCQQCLRANAAMRVELDTTRKLLANIQREDSLAQIALVALHKAREADSLNIAKLQLQLINLPTPRPEPKLFGLINVTPTQSFFAGAIVATTAHFIIGARK